MKTKTIILAVALMVITALAATAEERDGKNSITWDPVETEGTICIDKTLICDIIKDKNELMLVNPIFPIPGREEYFPWEYLVSTLYYLKDLHIPSYINYGGKEYAVTKISPSFDGLPLAGISIPGTVKSFEGYNGASMYSSPKFGEGMEELLNVFNNFYFRRENRCDEPLVTEIDIPSSMRLIKDSFTLLMVPLDYLYLPDSDLTIQQSFEKVRNVVCRSSIPYKVDTEIEDPGDYFMSFYDVYYDATHMDPESENYPWIWVPEGSIEAYRKDPFWGKFPNLREGTPSDVKSINTAPEAIRTVDGGISVNNSDGKSITVYSIDGIKVAGIDKAGETMVALPSGIYIVSDGRRSLKIKVD